jgi:hypothetical protein
MEVKIIIDFYNMLDWNLHIGERFRFDSYSTSY